MSELLKSAKELYGLNVSFMKWEYTKEEVTHETADLIGSQLQTIGFIAPWGGEWIASMMNESNDDTGEYIARLHNLFPELLAQFEKMDKALEKISKGGMKKADIFMLAKAIREG